MIEQSNQGFNPNAGTHIEAGLSAGTAPRRSRQQLFDALVDWTRGDLEKRANGHEECHTDCPNCHKSGSKKHVHFSFGIYGGKCFSCGQSWKLQELAETLGFDTGRPVVPVPAARETPEPSTPFIQAWRKNPERYVQQFQESLLVVPKWQEYRPFDLESIAKWRLGVGRLPSSACRHNRLIYPVVIGGRILGLRGRAIECECAKWLQSAGSEAQLFNQDALVPGCIAFIVESPTDVMLADQYFRMNIFDHSMPWVPIAGTAGAGTWKHTWSKLLVERKVAGVYLWLDNDLAGDPNPKMHKELLAMWRAKHLGTKTEPTPNAPKIESLLKSYGLEVNRYKWPDDAPAKADWGWMLQQRHQLQQSNQVPTHWGFNIIVEAGLALEQQLLVRSEPRLHNAPTLPEIDLDMEPPEEDERSARTHRRICAIPLEEVVPACKIPLEETRPQKFIAVRRYLDNYQYNYQLRQLLLLIKDLPGAGKTTMAVELAEELARDGKRVLFCGPRHDFFQEILEISGKFNGGTPAPWYEWLSQKNKNAEGEYDMCRHPEAINSWMAKGYEGKDFCSGVCGFKYMSKTCAYHQQKHKAGRLVFGQHAHLWTGLPVGDYGDFDVVICDENPMTAFLHEWEIPAKYIIPRGMEDTDPLREVLFELAKLVDDKGDLEGVELLERLVTKLHTQKRPYSLARLRETLEACHFEAGAKLEAPRIHHASDVENAPYGHLFSLIPMLLREARLMEAGTPGNSRVVVSSGSLFLLQRRRIHEKYAHLPMIWLDGTAEPRICEAISGRDVQVVDSKAALKGNVYQIHPYMHGKYSMYAKDKKGKPVVDDDGVRKLNMNVIARLREEMTRIIKSYGYSVPGMITYELVEGLFKDELRTAHFYGARGTNQFVGCDVIFVAGTPQPQMVDILKMAKMIYYDRDEPIEAINTKEKTPFTDQKRPYPGQPWAFPVGGYWKDSDLNAVLFQLREAEIEQAAHRGRPISQDCDVWLFSPLPITSLPPSRLLERHELYNAPKGVDPIRWQEFMAFADERYSRGEPIRSTDLTASDLPESLRLSRPKALEYIARLVAWQPSKWARERIKEARRGPRTIAAIPLKTEGGK